MSKYSTASDIPVELEAELEVKADAPEPVVDTTPDFTVVGTVDGKDYGFTVGTWAGMPNYKCGSCQWDTVDSSELIAIHVYDTHMIPAAQALPPVASIPTTEEV